MVEAEAVVEVEEVAGHKVGAMVDMEHIRVWSS